MRKSIIISFACALMLLITGCNNKPEPKPEPENLSGEMSAPAWTNPTNYDFGSSMTAVVKVDLLKDYPESAKEWTLKPEDKLAAFMGDMCCGVAEQSDGLFWLYITEPENASDVLVSIRYYSAHFRNLFEAEDAFPFQNDAHQGSVTEPFIPAFKVIKN